MSSSEPNLFLIWICTVSLSISLGLVQLYGLYGFYSIQHLVIIRKRYPKLVMIEAIAVIFLCLLVIPLWYNILLNAIGLNEYVNVIGWITIAPTNHLIANTEACRLWLMSFNLHYLHSSKNKKWKSEIDHSFATKDWYILNKNKYGNRNYVISRAVIYYVIASVVSTSCFLYFRFDTLHLSQLIDGLLFSVPVGFVIYTYFHCPKHHESNDNFYFHYEIKAITFIYCTSFLFYFTSTLVQYLGHHLLHVVLLLVLSVYGILFPSLVSTLWIKKKILANETWNAAHRASITSNRRGTTGDMAVMNQINGDIEKQRRTTLQRLDVMFNDEDLFESFVFWMYREFSNESILCFIELVQFKQYLMNNISDGSLQPEFILYDNVPKSSIVYTQFKDEEDESKKCTNMAHELYAKYIVLYAELEVNISGVLREKYRKLDEANWNVEMNEMMDIFDALIRQMRQFMMDSFTRFEISRASR
eukprot:390937_1